MKSKAVPDSLFNMKLRGDISICEMAARVFTGVVIVAQCCLLDYFMVKAQGLGSLGWIAADVLVLSVFVYLNIQTVIYFTKKQQKNATTSPKKEISLLPYDFIIWMIYSLVLVAKVAVMFKTFARTLPDEGWMDVNMLKIAIGMSAAVFALLIAGHHRSRVSQRHKFCLKWMQTHVVFELLDTVEFLSILFINEGEHFLLPFAVEDAIIAYSCINLIVPFIALYQVSRVNFAGVKPNENFILLQTVIATVFVNVPYMVIRVFLWHTFNFTTAIFIMKNFIAIISSFWELRLFIPFCARAEKEEEGKTADFDSTELKPMNKDDHAELARRRKEDEDPALRLQIPSSDSKDFSIN